MMLWNKEVIFLTSVIIETRQNVHEKDVTQKRKCYIQVLNIFMSDILQISERKNKLDPINDIFKVKDPG